MGLLGTRTRKAADVPPPKLKLVIYGADGIGKSELAAQFPRPYFLDADRKADRIKRTLRPDHFVPETWADVTALADELAYEKHSYGSFVVDTADFLERLLNEFICAEATSRAPEKGTVNRIEDVGGGFKKGWSNALEEWRAFIAKLDRIATRAHVVVLCHASVKTYKNPAGADYGRIGPAFQDQAVSDLFRGWAECVLYARFAEAFVSKGKLVKPWEAYQTKRELCCTSHAAYHAKNNLGMPETIPLSWDALKKFIDRAAPIDKKMLAELEKRIPQLPDDLRAGAAEALQVAVAAGDRSRVERIMNQVTIDLEEADTAREDDEPGPFAEDDKADAQAAVEKHIQALVDEASSVWFALPTELRSKHGDLLAKAGTEEARLGKLIDWCRSKAPAAEEPSYAPDPETEDQAEQPPLEEPTRGADPSPTTPAPTPPATTTTSSTGKGRRKQTPLAAPSS